MMLNDLANEVAGLKERCLAFNMQLIDAFHVDMHAIALHLAHHVAKILLKIVYTHIAFRKALAQCVVEFVCKDAVRAAIFKALLRMHHSEVVTTLFAFELFFALLSKQLVDVYHLDAVMEFSEGLETGRTTLERRNDLRHQIGVLEFVNLPEFFSCYWIEELAVKFGIVKYNTGAVDQTCDLVPNRIPRKIPGIFWFMANRNVISVLAVERNANTSDMIDSSNPVTSDLPIVEVFVRIDTIIDASRFKVE